MNRMTALTALGTALVLAGCANMTPPASPSAVSSNNNAYAYPATTTSSGSGNTYNWLEGGD
jgi:hypothetical protein